MRLSTLLFVPDDTAMSNLDRMRVSGQRIPTRGNTVLDALRLQEASGVTSGRRPGRFVLATCHRLETLKSRRLLTAVVECLNHVAGQYSVLFVMHKPTETALRKHHLLGRLADGVEPLPMQHYFDFVALLRDARFVIADGGSIQEECAALGVPLLILRSHTERQDGLEQNARLAHFDINSVQRFLEDVDSLRVAPVSDLRSPSAVVVDKLIEHDRAK